MSDNATNAARDAANATTEAMRAAAETGRRTVENMQSIGQVGREYLGEYNDASRKLFDAWATGAEATMRAAFDVQNSALNTSMELLQTGANSNRTLAHQWADVARQAQQAALEAFQANVRAAENLTAGANANE